MRRYNRGWDVLFILGSLFSVLGACWLAAYLSAGRLDEAYPCFVAILVGISIMVGCVARRR